MAEPIPPSEAKAASLGATDETSRAANNLATVRRALADLEFTFVELENGLKIPNVRGSLYIYDIFIASFPAMITFSIAMPFNIPTDRELIVAAIMGRINAKINIGNFESLSSRVYYRIGIPVNNLI